MTLSDAEKRVVNILYVAWRPLTTGQVADKWGKSWPTAKKYLTRLYNKKLLHKKTHGKSVYWWLKTKDED